MLDKDSSSIYPVIGSVVTDSVNFGMDSPVEKNLKSSYKKDVLIIEDSAAVSLVIHKFLKNLGYENIYTCTTGRNGVKIFTELAQLSKTPVVFLDYSLPDMTGDEVMEEIFDISPDAKIIIESANEKTDDVIKEILRHGAYEFLEKPIRFENLKNIVNVLEKEDNIIEDVPDYSFDKILYK